MTISAYGKSLGQRGPRTTSMVLAGTEPETNNCDCFSIGPIVGTHATRLEIDPSSDFFRKYGLLIAVADASPDDGDVTASQMILEELTARFYAWERKGSDATAIRRSVGVSLDGANQALLSRLADEERVTAQTTLAGVALFEPDVAIVFHVGDCRVLRNSAMYLRQLTDDHVDARIKPRDLLEKATAAQRRDPDLTRFMGLLGAGEPEMRMLRWGEEDTFLVGSKGWHGGLESFDADQIKSALYAQPDVAAFTDSSLYGAHLVESRHDATLVTVRIS